MRIHTLIRSALALSLLLISLATLGADYLACYMEYTGKFSASCRIASINATYSCALTLGAPRCFTEQEEELHCLYGLNRPGDLPEVSCIAAIPRATPGKAIHVTIDDARFGGPGKVSVRTVQRVEVAQRRRLTRPVTDAPERTIPTIGDLMRPPPPRPASSQDVEDALDALAAAEERTKATEAAAAAAASSAAQAAQSIKDDNRSRQYESPQRGLYCYWIGRQLYCDPR